MSDTNDAGLYYAIGAISGALATPGRPDHDQCNHGLSDEEIRFRETANFVCENWPFIVLLATAGAVIRGAATLGRRCQRLGLGWGLGWP